jgi:hypothetical protein
MISPITSPNNLVRGLAQRRARIESPIAGGQAPIATRNRWKRFLGSAGGTCYSYLECARYQLLLRVVRGLAEKNNFPVVGHSARTVRFLCKKHNLQRIGIAITLVFPSWRSEFRHYDFGLRQYAVSQFFGGFRERSYSRPDGGQSND